MSEQQFDESKAYVKKIIFGLWFFYAQIQERHKFGPLRWNIRYEFNDSDLDTALTLLPLLLKSKNLFLGMPFICDRSNYIRRKSHRRLGSKMTNHIIKESYKIKHPWRRIQFSDSGMYYVPLKRNIKTYTDYIDALQLNDEPEAFGMHPNININLQLQESDRIVTTILNIQPRQSSASGGKTPDELIIEKWLEIQSKLPLLLDRTEGKNDLFKNDSKGLLSSLTTVLIQEIERFNKLL